jgi:hypothetical protein
MRTGRRFSRANPQLAQLMLVIDVQDNSYQSRYQT